MEETFDYTVRWYAPGEHPADAFLLREEVFIREQGFREEFDGLDAVAWHLVLYHGGEPLATGRLFEEKGAYHLGRICVKKQYRKHHLGSAVVRALEQKACELGGNRVWLDAQLKAEPFYRSLGFERCGEEHMDEHCPHVAMDKALSGQWSER